MSDKASTRSRVFRIAFGTISAVAVVVAAYVFTPRRADLTVFDPGAMARAETTMWRHYYDRRYLALFADLYGVARDQYGFSPWTSARIAVAAARAAKVFQPTTSRAQAQAALPLLIDYFALLAPACPVEVDVEAAARNELDWWQLRREHVGPKDYGLIIAKVTTLLYGIDGEMMRRAGVIRAEAMDFRDSRNTAIAEADWLKIAKDLTTAYGLLKQAIDARPR